LIPDETTTMNPLLRALWRHGGMLVQPRATARALLADEGRYDGLVLGVLYVACVGMLEVLRGVAMARVTADLGGLLMLAAAVGRVLVAPIVVLVAVETVLGRARAHRRGLMLLPLLAVSALAHEAAAQGWAVRAFVPEIVGGLLGVALAWWVRPELAAQEDPA
jgi:hypothetical protein